VTVEEIKKINEMGQTPTCFNPGRLCDFNFGQCCSQQDR